MLSFASFALSLLNLLNKESERFDLWTILIVNNRHMYFLGGGGGGCWQQAREQFGLLLVHNRHVDFFVLLIAGMWTFLYY